MSIVSILIRPLTGIQNSMKSFCTIIFDRLKKIKFAEKKINFSHIFFNISSIITFFLFSLYTISSLGFLFTFSLTPLYVILSFVLSVLFIIKLNKLTDLTRKDVLLFYIILLFVFFISGFLSLIFYDFSWDGRTYHQQIIILLKNGWNPIYEKVNHHYIKDMIEFIENYPKAIEIIAANLLLITNNIEFSKVVNYLLFFNLLFLALYTFGNFHYLGKVKRVLLTLVLVFNPVAICQNNTFYVDGIILYIFLNIILLVIASSYKKLPQSLITNLLIMNLCLLSNTKLGGLFFVVVFVAFYYFYKKSLKDKNEIIEYKKFLAKVVVLLLVLGVNPYFTNMIKSRHPFYPIAGENKIEVMQRNRPCLFNNQNNLFNLFYSSFSYPVNLLCRSNINLTVPKVPFSSLKIPFSRFWNYDYVSPDTRIGGFGYWWGEILILTLIVICFTRNRPDINKKIYFFVIGILSAAVFMNPEAWWARYVPMFYALPVFVLVYRYDNKSLSFCSKFVLNITLAMMLANSFMVELTNLRGWRSIRGYYINQGYLFTKHIKKTFDDFKKNDVKKIMVYEFELNNSIYEKANPIERDTSIFQKLEENNVLWEVVDDEYYAKHKTDFKGLTWGVTQWLYKLEKTKNND